MRDFFGVGIGEIYIFTLNVGPCAVEQCVLIPIVNASYLSQCCIILEHPNDHDERIQLVDVKKNITIIPNISMFNSKIHT